MMMMMMMTQMKDGDVEKARERMAVMKRRRDDENQFNMTMDVAGAMMIMDSIP